MEIFAALLLIAVIVGAYFEWQSKRPLHEDELRELRGPRPLFYDQMNERGRR